MSTEEEELIKLCARALGMDGCEFCTYGLLVQDEEAEYADTLINFNPLTSDSDSSLLRRTLEIDVNWADAVVMVRNAENTGFEFTHHSNTIESKATAERLAVSKCAAEWQRRREESGE